MTRRPHPAGRSGGGPGKDTHVAPEALLAHAEGGALAAAQRLHLDGCDPCRRSLAASQRLLGDLHAPALAEPADAAVQRAIGLFPERPRLAARVAESLGRLVRAALPAATDGFAAPALAGVRGGAVAGPPLAFAHAAVTVEIEVAAATPAGAGFRVTGQALAPAGGAVAGIVWAEHDGWRSAEVPIGGHGMFQVEALPAATAAGFDLVVDLGDERVRLEVRPHP